MTGGTRTDLALELAEKECFCFECGLRKGVQRLLLVLTDGKSSGSASSMVEATKNLKVYAYIHNDSVTFVKCNILICVKLGNYNKLNFNEHISKLCKSASAQLNAIFRLRYKLPFKAKHILINSFVNANFSYCPLIWHFSSSNSLLKIETIKIRSIRLLSDDGEGNKNLFSELERDSMKVKRLKSLCIEIYKTLNDLNPSYMKKVSPIKLQNKPVRTVHEKYLIVPTVKSTTFGTNSLRSMGPKIWNNLPNDLKSSETLSKFKNIIKRYEGIEQILLLYKN